MIHQRAKDVYFALMYPCSKVLRPLYQVHYRLFRTACVKTQIGSGTNYLEGFVNIDANFQRRVDYLLDVRAGLPFPDSSMEFVYSCHMLEHLHVTEAISLLREFRRVLAPSGYIRLTLPDFEFIFQILEGRDLSEFPRRFMSRHGQAINFLFCDGQHRYAYSLDLLRELAGDVGFSRVEPADHHRDKHIPNLDAIEPGGSFSVNIFK